MEAVSGIGEAMTTAHSRWAPGSISPASDDPRAAPDADPNSEVELHLHPLPYKLLPECFLGFNQSRDITIIAFDAKVDSREMG